MTQRIVFVDPAVAEAGRLLATVADGTRVVWLDRTRDGVLQMTEALAGLAGVASIEILSHGAAGVLELGATRLDAAALARYAEAWSAWRAALAPGADILLYGCNVADSPAGASFIAALAQATGADVAASTDITGAGGDWLLEAATGVIESTSSLRTDGWLHTLDTLTGTSGNDTLTGTAGADSLSGAAGDDVLDGAAGNDTLRGDDGNDTLLGGLGNDSLVGGTGSDTASYAGIADGVIVSLATGGAQNTGGGGIDTLSGIEGLVGGTWNDTLTGSGGANTLSGGTGNDLLLGQGGNDTAVFAGSSGFMRLGSSGGVLTVQDVNGSDGGAEGFDTLLAIENLAFADRTVTPVRGGEIRANTANENYQQDPAIATLAGGSAYVVVWTSDLQDGDSGGIHAQRFDANGLALGVEFKVNTTIANNQSGAAVTALSNGGFVVVWQSYLQDGDGNGVYAQRYDASGVALGAEVRLNTFTLDDQELPSVAALAGGGFVATWGSQHGSTIDVYARRFNNAGVALDATEVLVNTYATSTQDAPVVAALDGGGYVIAWQSFGQDGDQYGIYAQRFNANGTMAGTELRVSNATIDDQYRPAIAALDGGGFVVVWEDLAQDGSGAGIYGQRYNAVGVAQGGEFHVSTTSAGSQSEAAVVGLAGGGFTVAWYGYRGDVGYQIWAQNYDAAGARVGGEYRLSRDSVYGASALAALGDGFLGAWEQYDGSSGGILLHEFAADGSGTLLRVNGTSGADRIDIGGYGDMQAAGGAGNDTYVVDSLGDSLIEGVGGGTDTVEALTNWTLAANFENLTLTGFSTLSATGNSVANVLTGNSYDNVLAGLAGDDTLTGGFGIDSASYATAASAITIDLRIAGAQAAGPDGADTLIEIEGVIGTAYADTLIGNAVANLLAGGAGNDTLTGFAGNDTLEGGAGADRAIFDGVTSSYRFGFSANGYITIADQDGNGGTDSVRDIEALDFQDRDLDLIGGGEIRVNSATAGHQQDPAIARLAAGGYVITWSSGGQDGSEYGIYQQRYAAAGHPLGGEVRVNTTTIDNQYTPAIAALREADGGGYVIVWVSELQDGDGRGVFAQRYSALGAKVGGEIQVNTTTLGDQQAPVVTVLDGGGFVVAWQGYQPIEGDGIWFQRFSASGVRLGAETRANLTLASDQEAPAIAALADGGFQLAWQSYAQDGDQWGVFTRRFAANGSGIGGEVQLSTQTAGTQYQPRLAVLENGSYVAAWLHFSTVTGSYEVHAQRHAADGSALGSEFRVGELDGYSHYDPTVTALEGGGFVVAWSTYGDGNYGVFAQRYTAAGAVLGDAIQLSSSALLSTFAQPEIAALEGGGFVAAWRAYQDADGYGIYAQRVDADGVLQLIELQGTDSDDRLDIGGAGDLQAIGGLGNDTYVVNSLGDRIVEQAGEGADTVEALTSWTLASNFERLVLAPGAGAINGTGNDAANQITGNEYANVLDGRERADTLDGGGGFDIASYATAPTAVTVSLALAGAQNTGGGGTDTLLNIEGVYGSGFADSLGGDAFANLLFGDNGADTLDGGAGDDTLEGGGGNDVVVLGGVIADYRFGWSNGYLSIADLNPGNGDDGTDLLRNVEIVRFADRDMLLVDGGERRVNTTTASAQDEPAIAQLAGGGYVVAWTSYNQDGSVDGVYAQRYSAAGVAQAGEFRVATTTYDDQHQPAVVALSGGGFLIAWATDTGDGDSSGVFAQRFGPAGAPLGDEFQLNTYITNQQFEPALAPLGSGFVACWSSGFQDGSGNGVYLQRFDGTGAKLGAEILVNTATLSNQQAPVVATLAGGSFVVAWHGYSGADAAGSGVYLQRFNANGAKLGGETLVNTATTGDQYEPAIAALGDGGFVIAWTGQDGDVSGVFAQRFAANGTAQGGEVLVNSFLTSYQYAPSVTALADGYVVSWSTYQEDGSGQGIYGQRYALDGSAVGAEFRINTTITGDQTQPVVQGLADGGFVVAWHSWYQDGDQGGIYQQRFDANGIAQRIEIDGTTGADRIDLGGAGDLQAAGGEGDDTYVVDSAGDRLIEHAGEGTDTVEALGSWTLGAGFEALRLLDAGGAINGTGSAGGDSLTGNASANVLEGAAGNDLIDGGAGSDTAAYTGAGSAVTVSLLLQGSTQNTIGAGSDTLAGIENLLGSAFADVLTGDAAANRIDGGAGNDRLIGGEGDDTLLGGTGAADMAVFDGNSGEYRLGTLSNGFLTVTHLVDSNDDGIPDLATSVDTLLGIETLRFDDRDIAVKPGGETPVNTTTVSSQGTPDVAVLANGSSVIVWQSNLQDGSGYGVYAQRFAADGATLGGEFRIATTTLYDQQAPRVAALAGGGFVVTWESNFQDGSGEGVYAQRYSAAGVAQGVEFRVNTTTAQSQYAPVAVGLAGGGFVIAWNGYDPDNLGLEIHAQRYGANGLAQGGEWRVNTTVAGQQAAPVLSALADGGFVVAWEGDSGDGNGDDVHAQRYDANGVAQGGEILANTTQASTQHDVASAVLGNGNFVLVWSAHGQDGSDYGIYAQRFSAAGAALGGEFLVNSVITSAQIRPAVTALADGGFVVAWSSFLQDGSGYGVYAQRFNAAGIAQGAEFRINTWTASDQSAAQVDALPGGGFVVTWQSYAQDGSVEGVYTQRFDANGRPELVQVDGTSGSDTIDLGGAGDMQSAGGAGNDSYVVNSAGDRAIEAAGGGNDTILSLIDWTLGVPAQSIENLQLIGNAVAATGNNAANVLTGNALDNLLSGGGGDDTLYGGAGDADVAIFAGLSTGYLVQQGAGFVLVTDIDPLDGDDGADQLRGVELLHFSDTTLGVDDIPAVGEFRVNATTPGLQEAPAVAGFGNGNVIVVWSSADTGGTGIWYQRFAQAVTEDGTPSNPWLLGERLESDDVRANTTIAGSQANAAVASLADDSFVIVWDSNGQDGDMRGIYAQRYDADGVAQGNEFRVNATTTGEQRGAAITALSGGGFVVSWESGGQDGSSYGIYAQRYNAAGVAQGGEFRVNTATANQQLDATICALGTGFVVAWESSTGDTDGYGVLFQRYSANGVAQGGETRINTTLTGDQNAPAIAQITGGFVAVWQSDDADGTGIFGQRFDTSGNKQGGEFAINTETALDQAAPAVSSLSGGGFAVSWSSLEQDGSVSGVYTQVFDASANRIGLETRVNTTTVDEQSGVALAGVLNGRFVLAWQSDGQDGSGLGIYAKAFAGSGVPLAAPLFGTAFDDVLDLTVGDVAAFGLAGNDTYIVDSASDLTIELGAEGNDTVAASVSWTLGANIESLDMIGGANIGGTGNAADNAMTGNAGANTLRGNDGNDSLDGGTGNDLIFGGSQVDPDADATGDDTLDGGIGADTMQGGLGGDTYYVDDPGDLVQGEQADGGDLQGGPVASKTGGNAPHPAANGGSNIDTVISQVSYTLSANVENLELSGNQDLDGAGNELDNLLTGNDGNNLLDGKAGIDLIDGGAGDDTLDGGAGADTLGGGLDDDWYVVDANDTLLEGAGEGFDTIETGASWTLANRFEGLLLSGSANLDGTGNGAANRLTGNTGTNHLSGGVDDDTLEGGAGNDTLSGGTDDDSLDGGTGNDSMTGSIGNDTYVVGAAGDTVVEAAGAGTDTVITTIAIVIPDNVEILQLMGAGDLAATGNTAANRLHGNGGANTLDGKAGADTLAGGAGNDTYVTDGVDQIDELGGEGFDLVQASVSYTLGAELEYLRLTGSDSTRGTGNALANTITGNTGNNTLDGGAGADSLAGAAGNDTYIVDAEDTITESAGVGIDTVRTAISWTLGSNLENLALTGPSDVAGTGNDAANEITGNAGDNTLDGGAGADTLDGGAGDDSYRVDALDVASEDPGAGTDTVFAGIGWTLGANIERLVLESTGDLAGTGNVLANEITGTDGANALNGGAGNDTLAGLAGNDTLTGGADADSMIGGDGDDTYNAEAADTVVEDFGAGNDLVRSAGSITLALNIENLLLTGSGDVNGNGNQAVNTLTGNDGSNSLAGAGGTDTLGGGAGNDTLFGGTGADSLAGGLGDDTYQIDAGDTFTENPGEGTDTIVAAFSVTLGADFENLTLTGTDAADATGNAALNVLVGNDGANDLDGLAGADTMSGGKGADTYHVTAGDVISENTAQGIDTVESVLSWTLGANFEHLLLRGSGNFAGTGNGAANRITGNAGANTLDGGAGNDTLTGGAGNDVYVVDAAGDGITELAGEGTDTVQSAVVWTLGTALEKLILTGTALGGTGNAANNTITGNAVANSLAGGAGNDTLTGGGGIDTMAGGAGNDTFLVTPGDVVTELAGAGTDIVKSGGSWTLGANIEKLTLTGAANASANGNGANNTLTGNGGNNRLTGLAGNDTLSGNNGNDTLDGGNNNDSLVGGGGADRLAGGSGNDTLKGGIGNDTLTGGVGTDAFVFENAPNAATNLDTIADFATGVDRIRLDDDVFTAFSAGVAVTAAQLLVGAGATVATTAAHRLVYDTTSGALYYDADGNAGGSAAVQIALLGATTHPATLATGDFAIVA